MHRIALLACVVLLLACTTTNKSLRHHPLLNGNWIPVRQELNGVPLPKAAYKGYVLTIADSGYTYTAHDSGAIYYENGRMDIYGRKGVNAGKHFKAIYKLGTAGLTICYDLDGTGYPTAFDTKGGPALFLSVYRKE